MNRQVRFRFHLETVLVNCVINRSISAVILAAERIRTRDTVDHARRRRRRRHFGDRHGAGDQIDLWPLVRLIDQINQSND